MDINIDSQIVIQTAAQWAADTDVYSEKRILVTSDVYYTGTDQRKFKLANGVHTWANLDYMPLGGSTTWGGITGTLSNQTDLQNALNAKASISYVDSEIDAAIVGLLNDRGNYDASSNVFPSSGGSGTAGAILKGDLWTISVAGTLGGTSVTIGDVVRALVDSPSQTASNWSVTENNIGYVPENNANKTDLMSGNTTSSIKFLSAKGVYDWVISLGYQVALTATNFGAFLNGLTAKTSLANNDEFTITDSAASYVSKKITWTNIKSALATVFYLDATSSIQTQLNNRLINLNKTATSSVVTGTTANTLLDSLLIPANTFKVGTAFIKLRNIWTTIIATKTTRIYINTSADLSGATLIGTYAAGSGANSIDMGRILCVKSLTSFEVYNSSATAITDQFLSGAAPSTITYDSTVDNYIIVAIQHANTSDSCVNSFINFQI